MDCVFIFTRPIKIINGSIAFVRVFGSRPLN